MGVISEVPGMHTVSEKGREYDAARDRAEDAMGIGGHGLGFSGCPCW